ncbi:hypothetical protein [Mycobacterium sp.]|uniref:hypothetical protein n=1 Tax=Mycobacterium sp. TaxID=1785 RepID=UPI0025FDAD3D|nr:hypothetical protein [Mycobacterium sp.]
MSTPAPPPGVVAAVAALRAGFADLHVMYDCDDECPSDCDLSDYSESAYRSHDEHNADVREDIEERASGLVDALEEWLGPDALGGSGPNAAANNQPPTPRPVEVDTGISEIDGAHIVQIDTADNPGRIRVFINDGTVYDGYPETDWPPGSHYRERPECEKRRPARVNDEDRGPRCDECHAATDVLLSVEHEPSCSLHPDNLAN